jgi:hypothetical protein
MKRFFATIFVSIFVAACSLFFSITVHESRLKNSDDAPAIVIPFLQICQEVKDPIIDDSYLTHRLVQMRENPSVGADWVIPSPLETIRSKGMVQSQAPRRFRVFKAFGASGSELADPNVAVGPNSVVAVVDRSIAFFDKLGRKFSQTTLRQFFRALPDSGSVSIYYPKVVYDAHDGHFIVLFEALRRVDRKSWFFLAVSQTNDPRGKWAFWEVNMSLNRKAPTGFFGDYPGLGLDHQAIYLTANLSNWNFRFQYAKIRVFKKSEVYHFGRITGRDFFNLKDSTGQKAISIQPAINFDSAGSEFLVSNNPIAGNKITLWNIINAGKSNVALTQKAVTITGYQAPPDASQKGGPIKISTGDASLTNAVVHNGVIYTAHTIAVSGNKLAAIRFYQIHSDGRLDQEITYGLKNTSYYFPATMVDSRGNVVIVFNRSGKTQDVGIVFTGRKATDPRNRLQPAGVLQQGLKYYHFTKRLTQFWGAYSGIALDSDDSIWIMGSFAKNTDEWATVIGKVSY